MKDKSVALMPTNGGLSMSCQGGMGCFGFQARFRCHLNSCCPENKYDGKAEDHFIPGAQSSPMSDDTAPCKETSGSITRDIVSKAANSRALIRPAEKIVAGLHHDRSVMTRTNVGFETPAGLMASARPVSETKTLRVAWLPIKVLTSHHARSLRAYLHKKVSCPHLNPIPWTSVTNNCSRTWTAIASQHSSNTKL